MNLVFFREKTPLDEYDLLHTNNYDYVLDLYYNNKLDIESIITNFNLKYIEHTITMFIESYRQTLNCLKMMDHRTVAKIGIRIFIYDREDGNSQYKKVLFNIWRSNRPREFIN